MILAKAFLFEKILIKPHLYLIPKQNNLSSK